MHEDTVSLLGDCTAGIEMALVTLDGLVSQVESRTMRKKLQDSVQDHHRLEAQAKLLLSRYGGKPRDPGQLARAMAWMKVNGKMAVRREDGTAAELVANGCDMGVRCLSRSRNRYGGAEQAAISLAQDLINAEEQLSAGMRAYL